MESARLLPKFVTTPILARDKEEDENGLRRIKPQAKLRFVLFFLATMLYMQHSVGQDVRDRIQSEPSGIGSASLSAVQIDMVRQLLKADNRSSTWECPESELDEALQHLSIQSLPVAASAQPRPEANSGPGALLIEPGTGCWRGGQGANAAMWVVDFRRSRPVLIASPADDFQGYLSAVGPAFSHGLPDIVLAWHMGAGDNAQTHFRFDGVRYRVVD
jgi:hypothetical protein